MAAAATGITVAVRLRPFNQREIRLNCANVVSMPSRGVVTIAAARNGKICESEKPREFVFDECFWTHDMRPVGPDGKASSPDVEFADQQYVYDRIGEPCVRAVLGGFHGCLFAYGQTGSGKTYTMMGYQQDPGLIPRMCSGVFAGVKATDGSDTTLLSIECSYMEIHNERVVDLLDDSGRGAADSGGLRVRQHPSTGVFVEGLKKFAVASEEEVLLLISEGDKHRTVAATNMNAVSSRSHAILVLYVSQTRTDAAGGTTGKSARMSLVDLAGSERASATGAEGDTLMTGASINKSLTVLGMCLARLAEASESQTGKSSLPIPFRDSNLTFILNESIGGNSKTTMLTAISPADVNAEETLSALRFAQVTKRVKTKPTVNENPSAKIIRELREELAALRERLGQLSVTRGPATAGGTTDSNDAGVATDCEAAPVEDEASELLTRIETSAAAIKAGEAIHSFSSNSHPRPPISGPSGAIYVDWSLPNLINASPTTATPLLPLSQGKLTLLVDDTACADSALRLIEAPTRADSPVNGEGCGVELEYVAVRKEVALTLAAPSRHIDIAVNGVSVARGARVILAHNDRLVIGNVALRLAHPASVSSARDFSCVIATDEHLHLLEDLHRKMLLIEEHRTYLQEFGITDDDEADEDNTNSQIESDEKLTRLVHERNTLEVAAAALYPVTGEELRLLTTAAGGGAVNEADALLTAIETGETCHSHGGVSLVSLDALSEIVGSYDALIQERHEAIRLQEVLIKELRKTLHEQVRREGMRHESYTGGVAAAASQSVVRKEPSSERDHAGPGMGSFASDGAQTDASDAEATAVQDAIEAELQWHSAVINLRQFKPHGPLDDPAATALWTRLAFSGDASKKPFFKEVKQRQISAFLEAQDSNTGAALADESTSPLQRRMSSMLLLSPWRPLHMATAGVANAEPSSESPNSARVFSSRGAVLRSGPFHKLSQNSEKWEQRYGLICDRFLYYFHECDGTQRAIAGIYLSGATFTLSTRLIAKRDHCILLTTTTPRRANDGTSSYYLSFRTAQDRLLWCHWIAEASVPPIPRLMKLRLREELAAGVASGAVTVALIQSRPDLAKFFYIPVSEWGFPELQHVTEASDDKRSHMNWDADETVAACTQCHAAFSFFRRRHHCRACGSIFCDSCTSFIPMKNEKGQTKPKRACKACASSRLVQVPGAISPEPQKPPANHHEV
jgi:hypothetical protein